jgi:NAD(P)-dependent dehydrogenase (short-subunit alcohol dehydrogenase family)
VADCGDRASIKQLMAGVVADHGFLEGLVLNASIMPGYMAPCFSLPDELEEAAFRINVEGYWWCLKYAMPALLAAPTGFERTVVFVSGAAGALEKPPPALGMMVYSTTLAAENGLMVRLHQEMVSSSPAAKKLRGSNLPKDMLQRVVSLHPGIVAVSVFTARTCMCCLACPHCCFECKFADWPWA